MFIRIENENDNKLIDYKENKYIKDFYHNEICNNDNNYIVKKVIKSNLKENSDNIETEVKNKKEEINIIQPIINKIGRAHV